MSEALLPPIPDALRSAVADRYDVERVLGVGGMATVYLARDRKHDRRVALKELRADVAAGLGAERFLAEIKTTAALQHPHILALFDSGHVAGTVYYAMPFVDGESLRARIDRERQLPVPVALAITRQVAAALQYAHERGIIHRDIKPENILLQGDHAVVADFGVALAVRSGSGRLTETGMALGTPTYMSPEQALGERTIDARSDIYALGCVLYEMLVGDPPHKASSLQALVAKILTERPTPVAVTRDTVPLAVQQALETALAKLPADRFSSAAEFAAALEATTVATQIMPATGQIGTPRPWWRDGRWWTLLMVSSVCGGGFALLLQSGTKAGALDAPVEYDIALPDGAPLAPEGRIGFAVSRDGHFVVYRAPGERGELWYRALLNGDVRRISGTEGAELPAISPDGKRVAFLNSAGAGFSIDVVTLASGQRISLGPAVQTRDLRWTDENLIEVFDGNGRKIRWLSPDGGNERSVNSIECELPSRLDANTLLCGGGATKLGYTIDLRGGTTRRYLRDREGRPVYGSQFRLVGDGYICYVSKDGNLMAARFDRKSLALGLSVRMTTGIARREFTGAALFDISPAGQLVYASGDSRGIGYLVRADGTRLDTLPFGRLAFLNSAFSADGARAAVTVDGAQGVELRVFDLESNRQFVWVTKPVLSQPIWNAEGDRLLFSAGDTVFVGSPDMATPPRAAAVFTEPFVPFHWLKNGRVAGLMSSTNRIATFDLAAGAASLQPLRDNASFPTVSPNQRWLMYADAVGAAIWVEPLPSNGKRFVAVDGGAGEPLWRADNEIAVGTYDADGQYYERVTLAPEQERPLGAARRWITLHEFRDTPGPSVSITPGGRIVYLQGAREQPMRFLRVVPSWTTRVRAAVDSAEQRQ
ncbi:MAG: protein kinase domain-containing protein [Gemmatimonas sp.]